MAKGTVVWTPEEDQQLKKLVGKFGEKKWAIIASHFERKVSKQCRRRWQNVLNANLKQGLGKVIKVFSFRKLLEQRLHYRSHFEMFLCYIYCR